MVTLADGSASGDASQGLLGDALCVLSALLYSGYTVALQAQLRYDSPEAPALFFGVIGCMTAALGLPLLGCGQLLGWWDVRALQPQALALAGINGKPALLLRLFAGMLVCCLQVLALIMCYDIRVLRMAMCGGYC
jgi:drug/metabolite transporter (DMT)-like permease